jgi:tetratricopeptide (TPR) repeat protein
MKKLSSNQILNKKQQALNLFKKSLFNKAIDLLNQIILEDKVKDPMSFFLLGTSYLHERDLELAEKNLKISIDQNKSYYNSNHNLGVTLQLKEKFNEALDSFKKALELKPKNLGTINHIAECYERIKSFDDAKKYYNKVIEIDPNNKIALKGLSRILIKFGFHKQGLDYFQKSAGLIRFSKENFKIIS